ncbi:hypothetical protein GX90_26915 [Salmonella enterica subsp. enterica]|nr:hypothetical protein [Salmonella enterica subsp. enterica serovar Duisburg]EAX8253231.1 hypothetical protein [Salmonella enterica]
MFTPDGVPLSSSSLRCGASVAPLLPCPNGHKNSPDWKMHQGIALTPPLKRSVINSERFSGFKR